MARRRWPAQRQGPPAPRAGARWPGAVRPAAERAQPQRRPAAAGGLHRPAGRRRRRLRQPRAPEGVAGQGDPRSRRGVHHRARLRRGADARPLRPDHRASPPDGPSTKIDPNVLDTLRLGAHQLLGMRVPTHAAVDETVALARKVNGAGAAGFVNAVMRRVSERDLDAWLAEVVPAGRADRAAGRRAVATPSGSSRRCGQPCSVTAPPPPTTSTPSSTPWWPPTTRRQGVARRPPGPGHGGRARSTARRGRLGALTVGAVLDGGDPGGIPAVRDGRAAVQDEGSQLVALALAAVPVEPASARPSSGSTSAPVRAARPGCSRGWPSSAGADLTANEVSHAPHRPGPADPAPRHRPGARRGSHGHGAHRRRPDDRRGRARTLRPGARRRPVHRAGRPAPSPGGTLAAHARRPRRPRQAPARAARRAPSTPPRAGRGHRLRHLQPAPGRDLVRRRRRRPSAGPTSSSSTPASSCATPTATPSTSREPGRPCSSGRTCTAPTGCSWRCCARRPDRDSGPAVDRRGCAHR